MEDKCKRSFELCFTLTTSLSLATRTDEERNEAKRMNRENIGFERNDEKVVKLGRVGREAKMEGSIVGRGRLAFKNTVSRISTIRWTVKVNKQLNFFNCFCSFLCSDL